MTTGPGIRPLLPQKSQMQTFSFAPPNLGLGDNKKNYVFVDEHNRHKRLKVMRACEGCRRRKIKCDAATTNSWPCAACVRLKIFCVPPTVNYDRARAGSGSASGLERVLDFDTSSGSGDDEYGSQIRANQGFDIGNASEQVHPSQSSYGDGLGVFHTPPYSERPPSLPDYSYSDVPTIRSSNRNPSYHDPPAFQRSNSHTIPSSENSEVWSTDSYSAVNLSDVLGELKIDETGIAPYISRQKQSLAEAPALDEFEVKLPPITAGSGSTVRIPPELMPPEEQCMEYFDIFFANVHPYVPVISKSYFYQQWRTNRRSISPLILEAIFACSGRMSEDPAQGAQWLALASKHEDCFMDVPRLSTIQAVLILLKARESAPKRGYYYRSWMTVKILIVMAKDLELHNHYAVHQEGRECGSDPTECLIKTRIWQNIFMCELMVGGPQGRLEFGVDTNSVDVSIQRSSSSIDASDSQVSRQFTYLVRSVRNVRIMTDMYGKLRTQKDWGADPRFVNLNPSFLKWLDDLPGDLQLNYPGNGTPPWLTSHFVGNMHSYHHLSIIMLHRPQLMYSRSFNAGGSWQQHMALCYSSAKSMCRLQEGILQTFGLSGLLCMQRGINFTIYAILTCTMIHLVAITSPDPDFNTDAKDYFTRHMRILEDCMSSWPMPEVQAQIDALREAFSADITRPFELKPSFPYGSPAASIQHSQPIDIKYGHQSISRHSSYDQGPQGRYNATPMTPPISAGHDDPKEGPMAAASLTMMAAGQRPHQQVPSTMRSDQSAWNPTRLFDQWNTAFPAGPIAAPANPMPQPSPPLYTPPSLDSHDLPPLHDAMQQNQQYPIPASMAPPPQIQTVQSYTSNGPSFVSPSMWQDTVASTYDPGGLKRRWDMDSSYGSDPMQMKRPRSSDRSSIM